MRFEYVLARALSKTHAQLLAETSAREMVWWRALYAVEHTEQEKANKAAARRR